MGLISWLGQKLSPTPATKPDTQVLGIGKILNRWSTYPSFYLTPQKLRNILWMGDLGYMRFLVELFEEMEEKDSHLSSIIQTRKLAPLGLPLEIQPASEDSRDKEIAEFVEEQIQLIPDFRADLLDLLDAIAKGYSALEIFWEIRGTAAVVADLEWIHPKSVTFVNSPTPLLITESNRSGEPPPPWKIIFHRYRGRSSDICRGGVLRACALPYLLKNYNLKFWAIYNELYGIPMRIGKYDLNASPEDRSRLEDALKSMGTDAYAAVSKNIDIEFLETKATGRIMPHQALVQFCNNEMSKAVLGQTLTTDTAGATGTFSAGKIHEMVRQDIVEADAIDLAAVLQSQLVRPLVGFNFGWEAPLPKVMLVSQEAIDFKTESEGIKNFAEVGLPIPHAYCYDRYGIAPPVGGEPILEPPVNIVPPRAYDRPGDLTSGLAPTSMKGALPALIQRQLEDLTQAASKEAQRYLGKMLAPVAHLIDSGADLTVIREHLLSLYASINTRDLEILLAQVRILANLKGRQQGK
jgi:phage gp29-like protein